MVAAALVSRHILTWRQRKGECQCSKGLGSSCTSGTDTYCRLLCPGGRQLERRAEHVEYSIEVELKKCLRVS
eukprot:1937715-Amphidinium_carterae.1